MLTSRSVLVRSAFCLAALLGVSTYASANPWWLRGGATPGQGFLPPDAAFRVAAHIDGKRIRIRWIIADGYYLYRHQMSVAAESPDLTVFTVSLPPGTRVSDRFFGTRIVYFHTVEATAAYVRSDFGAHPMQIKVTYQGCAQAGLCYPPIVKVIFPDELPPAANATLRAANFYSAAELIGIFGGGAAFLFAGVVLRKHRRLPMPKP